MTVYDLKQIQLYRQHLTHRADHITVARDLCGLQAQFLSNALHGLRIRCTDYDEAAICHDLVKNWTVRGTVHLFAREDLSLFLHCNNGADYRNNTWLGRRFWNDRACWALTPERQQFLSDIILAAVEARPRTREELKELCRAAGMTEDEEGNMFDPWGGGIRELCERGFLNYTVTEQKAFCPSPPFSPIPEEEAMTEICRRYLTHIAPATLHDLCYYLKCTQKQARSWLSRLPVRTLSVQGQDYFYLGELPGDCPDIPSCLFLSGFDQLMLAYEKRQSIYLAPEHLRHIFNLAGIVMPALLLDGQVAGKWKMTRRRPEIIPFRPLTPRERAAVTDAAEGLWGDGVVGTAVK